MLLSQLDRKGKLKFLDLALHLASVDGSPTTLESRLLNVMLAEVGEDIYKEYQFSLSDDLDETIAFFEAKSVAVRGIVYLNLLRLTMLDDFYNTLEHGLLEEVRERFSIGQQKKERLMRLVYLEKDLMSRAMRVVAS
ncbi:MAG: hypothetical protein ACLFTZ_02220 [Acholeplasmataceae bacterium]